jgi:hypothetical protein
MQQELDTDGHPGLEIRVLGVNDVGLESGNAGMTSGRTCPWLQDTIDQQVWQRLWRPVYRDVIVLDATNRKITAYNLSSNDLALPANYAALKNLLLQAAAAAP